MVTRRTRPAPASQLSEQQRGRVVGRFCHGCGSVYSPYSNRHTGKPLEGKDHISTACTHEGETFREGAEWWEPALEVLPVAAAESTSE